MKIKRITAILLLVIILLGNIASQAHATIGVNDSSVCLKQEKSNTCTLVAMGVVFRRKAILDGNENWSQITENSMKKQGNWPDGLAGSPKFVDKNMGLNMKATSKHIYNMKSNGYERNSNPASTIAALKQELDKHPEGVVLYLFNRISKNKTKWRHAVTLTGYDKSGNFYCADPAKGNGIINLMDSILSNSKRANTNSLEELLSYSVKIWYISSSSNLDSATSSQEISKPNPTPKPVATPVPTPKPVATPAPTPKPECSHKYNDKGYCNQCGKEFYISLSSMSATYEATKDDVPVRNRPYAPEKIIKYLSKGTKVSVVASGKNSVGNLWYKLNDGTWIYSGNLKESTAASAQSAPSSTSIKFELDAVPKGNLKQGKSFSLKGWFRSDSPIVEAQSFILDSNKKVVMKSKVASSTTNNYKIQGYKLDTGLKFGDLKPGGYYLKYYVRDADGDTATWVGDMFYIVK